MKVKPSKEADGKLWIVVDTRLAREGVNSGISRFIVGFCQALVEETARLGDRQVLLVSKYEPAAWIVDLVRKHPTAASFWSGGKGSGTRRYEKPVYLWATLAFRQVEKLTGKNFVWVAPANFDRPVFSARLVGRKNLHRIIQIIHDTIAFEQRKSMGFLFGMQFRSRVRRTLNRFPLVCTVSEHSAELLRKVTRRKSPAICVLGEGVDPLFGRFARPADESERRFLRKEFLTSAGWAVLEEKSDLENALVGAKWLVGVGRSQTYKAWDVAERAVSACRPKLREGAVLIRVVGDQGSFQAYASRGGQRCGQALWFKDQAMLVVPSIPDDQLALLYRVSDALLHPSFAEGFGLPPLEAALSGLPVLYRRGTAVDGHFPEGSLPGYFWRGLTGSDEEWAAALLELLQGSETQTAFFEKMGAAKSPREFVSGVAGDRRFEWTESAQAFLSAMDTLPFARPKGS